MPISLDKFNLQMIAQTSVVVMLGRRRSGKSLLIRDVLFHNQDIPIGSVISGTEDVSIFFGKMVPKSLLHREVTPEVTSSILKRQVLLKRRIIRSKQSSNIDPRAFVVIDDCGYSSSWPNQKNVKYMAMNGRHVDLFILMALQDALSLPPNIRANCDFVFIFAEMRVKYRLRIYDNWASVIPTFEAFNAIMDIVTEDHGVLVIHLTSNSKELSEQVFYYKADIHEDFRLCDSMLWQEQDQRQMNDDELDLEDAEILKMFDEPSKNTKPVVKKVCN